MGNCNLTNQVGSELATSLETWRELLRQVNDPAWMGV